MVGERVVGESVVGEPVGQYWLSASTTQVSTLQALEGEHKTPFLATLHQLDTIATRSKPYTRNP